MLPLMHAERHDVFFDNIRENKSNCSPSELNLCWTKRSADRAVIKARKERVPQRREEESRFLDPNSN